MERVTRENETLRAQQQQSQQIEGQALQFLSQAIGTQEIRDRLQSQVMNTRLPLQQRNQAGALLERYQNNEKYVRTYRVALLATIRSEQADRDKQVAAELANTRSVSIPPSWPRVTVRKPGCTPFGQAFCSNGSGTKRRWSGCDGRPPTAVVSATNRRSATAASVVTRWRRPMDGAPTGESPPWIACVAHSGTTVGWRRLGANADRRHPDQASERRRDAERSRVGQMIPQHRCGWDEGRPW